MERERWLQLYELLLRLGKSFPGGWKYPTTTIAAVYFWSVLNDRSVRWACDPQNWSDELRPRYLPTQDRMSKRLRSKAVKGLVAAVEAALKMPGPEPVKAVDSKPLFVSAGSKDADAKWGRLGGRRLARGYKLHAVWGRGPIPVVWSITSLNVQDGCAAGPLFERLTDRGYVLGDGQYDQNERYEIAAAHGHQLLAFPRHPNAGKGHVPQSPHRRRGLALFARRQRWVSRHRGRIERAFGSLTSFAGGLTCLPAWVRTLTRVTLWVQAKLIINALRIQRLHPPLTATA